MGGDSPGKKLDGVIPITLALYTLLGILLANLKPRREQFRAAYD